MMGEMTNIARLKRDGVEYGWSVRLSKTAYGEQIFLVYETFHDKHYPAGKWEALLHARLFRDQMIEKYKTSRGFSDYKSSKCRLNPRQDNHSDSPISGVFFHVFKSSYKDKTYETPSWCASGYVIGKGVKKKQFSCKKYGYENARKMAIKWRETQIASLRRQNNKGEIL